ncbi:MAG: zinc-dependent alcohol dehydrogenase family protein [Pirellulales bacterium]
MKAMVLSGVVSLDDTNSPLMLVEQPTPVPGDNELLLRVTACGVCHTEIDEIEGRTAPPRFPIILGHEVVGRVVSTGNAVSRFQEGDRIGVGWIHSSCGGDHENLSPAFRATGRDVNGGYAEYMTVPQQYAYSIPDAFSDAQAAPLLCAGAIGYRALRLTGLKNGQRLGLTGFGGSAHLVLQLVRYRFPKTEIYVFARNPSERIFAMELGAAWAGDTTERAPQHLDAIIDTTPAWTPVVEALANLRPEGRLIINAIRKTETDKDALLTLSYENHLWQEKELKTVANITARDIREFLPLAASASLRPTVTTYPLEEANKALGDLRRGSVKGAKVLLVA